MRVFSGFSFVVRWGRFAALLLLPCLFLAACSGLNFGGTAAPTSTPTRTASVTLAKLHWCGKVLMIFRDEGATATSTPAAGTTPIATATLPASRTPTGGTTTPTTASATPVTITDWSQVQSQLGFTVYLPATLPAGTCLTSASGTIHDPIFGGSFTIGYLLADHSAVTLSEAPVRSQNSTLQCSASGSKAGVTPYASLQRATALASLSRDARKMNLAPTTTPGAKTQPLQICTGVRDTTNIVFSARGTTDTLTQFFKNLQPNVAWVPAS